MSGLYDWWSRHPRALRGLYALAFFGRAGAIRRRSIEALALEPGDRVLELGCGRGNSFAPLREAVGPGGTVVGVDYSSGMTRQAAARVDRAGWENVHVVRGDATRPVVGPGTFDAAYAAMSVSAMPDPAATIATAAASLRPDGRIAVLDARPFQGLPLSLLNPVVVPVMRWLTNWDHETDVPGTIRSHFETATVRGYNAGTTYVASGAGPRDEPVPDGTG